MEHTDNLYASLGHYFDVLKQTGSYDSRETVNLVIYLFIVNDILEGNLGRYLDDDGLAQIEKVLDCLYNVCLIHPVRENINIKEPNSYFAGDFIRYAETVIPRYSEDTDTRIAEDNG